MKLVPSITVHYLFGNDSPQTFSLIFPLNFKEQYSNLPVQGYPCSVCRPRFQCTHLDTQSWLSRILEEFESYMELKLLSPLDWQLDHGMHCCKITYIYIYLSSTYIIYMYIIYRESSLDPSLNFYLFIHLFNSFGHLFIYCISLFVFCSGDRFPLKSNSTLASI